MTSCAQMSKSCLLEATTYPSNILNGATDEKCAGFANFIVM